jgi:hypothetical protein
MDKAISNLGMEGGLNKPYESDVLQELVVEKKTEVPREKQLGCHGGLITLPKVMGYPVRVFTNTEGKEFMFFLNVASKMGDGKLGESNNQSAGFVVLGVLEVLGVGGVFHG